MNSALTKLGGAVLRIAACGVTIVLLVISAHAQTKSYERFFPQSKPEMERAIAKIQVSLAGHLPVLDGFAEAGKNPLDRYSRGFYQAAVQVSLSATGGSIVRVSAKVTAWYIDPAAVHSGYQLLVSNGRIESDLLDQLTEQLAASYTENADSVAITAPIRPLTDSSVIETRVDSDQPAAPAPSLRFSEISSSLSQGLASSMEHSEEHAPNKDDKSLGATNGALQAEAKDLEEVLRNQAHPKNLVAVKKSGTPVVATPSLTAKPEFLASQHDEFELLNFNADWVHVRISGLSRGWIWRNSVEMPEGIPDISATATASMMPVADMFRVTREETAQFPGDWEPLRSKNVKILTVQKVDDNAADAASKDRLDDVPKDGPKERLDYAKFMLEKTYTEMASNPQGLSGLVIIFDSTDGGMIAAPVAVLQQWKVGTLTDSALWHKCFFDPPELLEAVTPPGS